MKTPRMIFHGRSFYIPQANNHASFKHATNEIADQSLMEKIQRGEPGSPQLVTEAHARRRWTSEI